MIFPDRKMDMLSEEARHVYERLRSMGGNPKLLPMEDSDLELFTIFQALSELLGKNFISVEGHLKVVVAQESYHDYLNSPEWDAKRQEARKRAGYRCQVCNTNKRTLDTHHRTYERLGRELPDDLMVLCRDCHTLFSKNGKLARNGR